MTIILLLFITLFYRYVKNHKKLELDQAPNVEYLGHPINAYNLIKHSAIGWKFLNHSVVQPLNISLGHIGEYLEKLNICAKITFLQVYGKFNL